MRSFATRNRASFFARRSSRGVADIGWMLPAACRPLPPGKRGDAGNDVAMSEETLVEPDAPQPYAVAPAAAAELIDAGATLIDVRRDYEFDAGHLESARNIEMNELTAHAEEIAKDRPVIFYCRSGNRSSMAAAAFSEGGWDAHNLGGGIVAWAGEGRPLEPAGGEVAEPLPPS